MIQPFSPSSPLRFGKVNAQAGYTRDNEVAYSIHFETKADRVGFEPIIQAAAEGKDGLCGRPSLLAEDELYLSFTSQLNSAKNKPYFYSFWASTGSVLKIPDDGIHAFHAAVDKLPLPDPFKAHLKLAVPNADFSNDPVRNEMLARRIAQKEAQEPVNPLDVLA
ncbi:MAG: hypothetical protein K2X66_08885 [Cyanobacteria bacterium]|nr:hypothetical protein [Cyanobacteriota bacterium]